METKEELTTKLAPIPIPNGLPTNLDWRTKGKLEEVRNQGDCQACWAVTTIQVLEAVWNCTKPQHVTPLSPQMLIDCVEKNPPKEKQDNKGIYQLSALKAFQWLKDNEVYGEVDYPYLGRRGNCRIIQMPSVRVRIDDVGTIKGSKRLAIFERVAMHPVAAVLNAYPEFINLKNEIYEGPKEKPEVDVPHHAVAIIGYGTEGTGENAKNYWLIMSSWGRSWGMDGVGRVSRDYKVDKKYLVRRVSYPIFHEE